MVNTIITIPFLQEKTRHREAKGPPHSHTALCIQPALEPPWSDSKGRALNVYILKTVRSTILFHYCCVYSDVWAQAFFSFFSSHFCFVVARMTDVASNKESTIWLPIEGQTDSWYVLIIKHNCVPRLPPDASFLQSLGSVHRLPKGL